MKRSPLSAARPRRAVLTAAVTLAAAGALTAVFTAGERRATRTPGDAPAAPRETARGEGPEDGDASQAGPSSPAERETAAAPPPPAMAPVDAAVSKPRAVSLTEKSVQGSAGNPPAPATVRSLTFGMPAPAPWTEESARPAPNAAGDGYTFTAASDRGVYTAGINADGVSLRPAGDGVPEDAAAFSLRLKTPAGSAFAADTDPLATSARLSGNTVEIPRSGDVTEWYRNTPRGVEQGFTLARPQSGGEPGNGVRLELAAAETWTTHADAGTTSVRFRHSASGTEVGYENLIAFDATGRRLPARMEPLADGSGVALLASDKGAVYPVTVDPLFTMSTVYSGEVPLLGAYASRMEVLGNSMFFTLQSRDISGMGLWKADLTGAAAPRLVSTMPFSGDESMLLGKVGGKLLAWNNMGKFFTWTENSVTEEPAPFSLPAPRPDGFNFRERYRLEPFLFEFSGRSVFYTEGVGYPSLYATDGSSLSVGGTILFSSIGTSVVPYGDLLVRLSSNGLFHVKPRASFEFPPEPAGVYTRSVSFMSLTGALTVNGTLLLQNGADICAVRGTEPGVTTVVTEAELAGGAVLGNFAYFRKGGDVWKTDGTAAGTSRATAFAADITADLGPIYALNGALYFTRRANGENTVHRSDGTEEGTTVLKNSAYIPPGGDTVLYLMATTPEHGEELWVSDGTEAGTRILRDFTPGPDSTVYGGIDSSGNHSMFRAGGILWRTDGTPVGTARVFPEKPAVPALDTADSIAAAGSRVFFAGATPAEGKELWAADPATGIARLMKDIRPGPRGSAPVFLKAFGDGVALFFATAEDGSTELWRSDGTAEGTARLLGGMSRLVYATIPGSAGAFTEPLVSGGALWWFAHLTADGEPSLFRSDGTAAGTAAVGSDPAWTAAGEPHGLTPHGAGVVFTAGAGAALPDKFTVWRSDGAAAGTAPATGLPAEGFPTRPGVWATEGKVFAGDGPVFVGTGSPPDFSLVPPVEGVPLGAAKGRLYFHPRAEPGRLGATDGTPGNLTLGPFWSAKGNILEEAGNVIYQQLIAPPTQQSLFWKMELRAFEADTLAVQPLSVAMSYSYTGTGGFSPIAPVGGVVAYWAGTVRPHSLYLAGRSGAAEVAGALAPGLRPAYSALAPDGDRVYYITTGSLGQELRVVIPGTVLRVTASPPAWGTVTGGLNEITEAGPKPVTATGAAGYYFSHWEGAPVADPLSASTTVSAGPGEGLFEAVAVFTTEPRTFADWAASFSLTGEDAAPDGEPLRDGVPNLLKYAFRVNPMERAGTIESIGSVRGLPLITFTPGGPGRLLRYIFVRRRTGHAAYAVERSDDGVTWMPAKALLMGVLELDATWEIVSFDVALPPGTPKQFARVRVTLE